MSSSNTPQKPFKFDVRKEIAEITTAPHIVGGLIAILILLCCVPFFFFLLPFVIVVLVVLYKMSEGNEAKALKLARAHLNGKSSTLEISESVETANALVLNDWGIVYVTVGKPAIEVPWREIKSVDETSIGILNFNCDKFNFEVNLSIGRYNLITEALYEKLPGRVQFDVDPQTGNSNILDRLKDGPREWSSKKSRLIVSEDGIEYGGNRMSWLEISSVRESRVYVDEGPDTLFLTFSSGGNRFDVTDDVVSLDKELPCYTGYDLLKLIVYDRIPGRTQFEEEALTPSKRALEEFKRGQDATKAGFAFALKSGKLHVIEPHFHNMLKLVDKFHLDKHSCVQDFFQDYGLLFQKTGRDREAEQLASRLSNGKRLSGGN